MAFPRGKNRWQLEWMRVPPLPGRIVMTDRDDGTLWALTFSLSEPLADGLGHISINTAYNATDRDNYHILGAYEGPYLGFDPLLRLLVRGGYLGYEQVTPLIYGGEVRQGRATARLGVRTTGREIIIPTSWVEFPDMIGWQDVEF